MCCVGLFGCTPSINIPGSDDQASLSGATPSQPSTPGSTPTGTDTGTQSSSGTGSTSSTGSSTAGTTSGGSTSPAIQVTSASLNNGTLTLIGKNLNTATQIKISDASNGSPIGTFAIGTDSSNGTQILADGIGRIGLIVGKIYTLLVSNAQADSGSASLTVTFTGTFAGPVTILNSNAASAPSTSGTAQGSGLVARFQNSATNATLDVGSLANKAQWLQATQTGDLSQNFPLLLNPNGGFVGVGTSSPAYGLDLTATTTAAGPSFVYYLNTGFTSTAGATTKIVYDASELSVGGVTLTSGTVTPGKAGIYQINALATVSPNGAGIGAGTFWLLLKKNGNSVRATTQLWNYSAAFTQSLTISTVVQLAATDTLDVWIVSNTVNAPVATGVYTMFSGAFLRSP